jgi:hypothetical protein
MTQTVEPLLPPPSGRGRDELKSIAVYQKSICVCILVNLMALVAALTLRPIIAPFAGLFLLVPVVFVVFVILLAIKLYGTGVGVVLGILTLLPLIGLLILLIINGKATRTLKENGLKVGLLGADMKQFAP